MSGHCVKFMKSSSQNTQVTKEVKITQALSLEEQVKKVSSSDKQTNKKTLGKTDPSGGIYVSRFHFLSNDLKRKTIPIIETSGNQLLLFTINDDQ